MLPRGFRPYRGPSKDPIRDRDPVCRQKPQVERETRPVSPAPRELHPQTRWSAQVDLSAIRPNARICKEAKILCTYPSSKAQRKPALGMPDELVKAVQKCVKKTRREYYMRVVGHDHTLRDRISSTSREQRAVSHHQLGEPSPIQVSQATLDCGRIANHDSTHPYTFRKNIPTLSGRTGSRGRRWR
jgi:hypothetical protein